MDRQSGCDRSRVHNAGLGAPPECAPVFALHRSRLLWLRNLASHTGARNFFGPHASVMGAVALWDIPTAALALPWAAFSFSDRKQLAWRAPLR